MRSDKDYKGLKMGLKPHKSKMTAREFHEKHGHMGYCPDCMVCKMARGAMRRITKKVDPPRPES